MAIWDLINVHVKKALVKMERRYELGTHKRTYRIRSKVRSELVLHIIVSTAYTSTIFKKNKN